MDPKFVRIELDRFLDKFTKNDKFAHEIVDQIYEQNRAAVDQEIEEVDELFLVNAAKENKDASEIELNNLMRDKDEVEK